MAKTMVFKTIRYGFESYRGCMEKKYTEEQLESYNKRAEVVFKEINTEGEVFPEEATVLEKCVLHLRRNRFSYKQIQEKMGMLPKAMVREILLKYDPELINLDTNYHKIPDNMHKDYD